jgi:hypothetical protein
VSSGECHLNSLAPLTYTNQLVVIFPKHSPAASSASSSVKSGSLPWLGRLVPTKSFHNALKTQHAGHENKSSASQVSHQLPLSRHRRANRLGHDIWRLWTLFVLKSWCTNLSPSCWECGHVVSKHRRLFTQLQDHPRSLKLPPTPIVASDSPTPSPCGTSIGQAVTFGRPQSSGVERKFNQHLQKQLAKHMAAARSLPPPMSLHDTTIPRPHPFAPMPPLRRQLPRSLP